MLMARKSLPEEIEEGLGAICMQVIKGCLDAHALVPCVNPRWTAISCIKYPFFGECLGECIISVSRRAQPSLYFKKQKESGVLMETGHEL